MCRVSLRVATFGSSEVEVLNFGQGLLEMAISEYTPVATQTNATPLARGYTQMYWTG